MQSRGIICQWRCFEDAAAAHPQLCSAAGSDGVRDHVRINHTVPRLLCPFCLQATFWRKTSLIAHLSELQMPQSYFWRYQLLTNAFVLLILYKTAKQA